MTTGSMAVSKGHANVRPSRTILRAPRLKPPAPAFLPAAHPLNYAPS